MFDIMKSCLSLLFEIKICGYRQFVELEKHIYLLNYKVYLSVKRKSVTNQIKQFWKDLKCKRIE